MSDCGFFFFKQKTAYEMRISDWSSDVCSSDLLEREEVWRESSGAPRTAFAAQTYSEPFRRLGLHPRLIGPVMQLLDGPVYLHQYKVNAKAAFDGEVWQWHQDYGTWAPHAEMPEPRAMNIALFRARVRGGKIGRARG